MAGDDDRAGWRLTPGELAQRENFAGTLLGVLLKLVVLAVVKLRQPET